MNPAIPPPQKLQFSSIKSAKYVKEPTPRIGAVSFYKEAEGYGFIRSDDKIFVFQKDAIEGGFYPEIGDIVSFTLDEAKTALNYQCVAEHLHLTRRVLQSGQKEIQCPFCHQTIKPRVTLEQDDLKYLVCPSCGSLLDVVSQSPVRRTFFWTLFLFVFCLWTLGIFFALSLPILE